MRILGYVSPMFPLMDSADIILSKSGGLTSTEIMTKRKPFIVINPIEGVETCNASFLNSWARRCTRALMRIYAPTYSGY